MVMQTGQPSTQAVGGHSASSKVVKKKQTNLSNQHASQPKGPVGQPERTSVLAQQSKPQSQSQFYGYAGNHKQSSLP